MTLLKRAVRSPPVQAALGFGFARYLGLVRRTVRFSTLPDDLYGELVPLQPFIGVAQAELESPDVERHARRGAVDRISRLELAGDEARFCAQGSYTRCWCRQYPSDS